VARLVDHLDVVTRRREPHRAGAHRCSGCIRDEERVLGLAIAVVDREPEHVLEPLDDLGVQRLPGRDGVPEPRQVRLRKRVELRHHAVLRRCLAEHRHAEAVEQREPLLRVEDAFVDDHLGPVRPRAEEDVPDRLRPARAGRAPHDVLLVRVEPVARLGALRPGVRVRVHDALRLLRRAGGVEDQGGFSRRRLLGRRARDVALELGERLVEVEDSDAAVHLVHHLLDLVLARPVGDDQTRARVADPVRQVARAQHVGARHRDEPTLEGAQHRAVPGGHLAEDDENTVAAIEARPEQVRPACGVLRDVRERPAVDDPLGVDVGDALPEGVGGAERLDDVPGEVEAGRDVPPRWERAGAGDVGLASSAQCHGSALLVRVLPAGPIVLADRSEDVEHERPLGTAVRRVLDPAGEHVPLHRLELVRDAVDDERLHPAEHEPELLVGMAVQRDRRPRLELDHVQHRALAEQRPSRDALGQLERTDVVEAHEDGFHAGHSTPLGR
jgi:hypothetical protein